MNNQYIIQKRHIKVLFVGFSYVIDVYQSKLRAISELEGVKVALISPAVWKFPERKKKYYLNEINSEIKIYPAKIDFFNGRGGAFWYPLSVLIKAFIEFKPDIIYLEQEVFSLSTFEVALFSHFFKVPLVVFCWENTDKELSVFRKWTRNFVLKKVCFITPGNQGAAELIRKWGYKGPIQILPQIGVDINLFSSSLRKKNGRFCIGYVGRLVHEKGVDLILNAANILNNQGFHCRVIVCGAGPYRHHLEKLAEELQIADSIDWIGQIDYSEVAAVMSQFDVLVLPSRTISSWKEQFGHVLIEAMAMGIPVVGSSSGAIPSVIGRDDVIFAENDYFGLAGIIRQLLSDSNWREHLIEFGLDRVNNEYTDKRIATKLVSIFDGILQK